MKLRALLAAVFVLTFSATFAFAGGASEFGVNAGAAMPMGDFSDFAGTGFFGGATYCYQVNEMFGLGGDINYYHFGKKSFTEVIPGFGTVNVDVTPSILNYGVHGKYMIKLKDSKEMPYLKLGLGLYSLSAKTEGTGFSDTSSESDFGFNLGVGADWSMGEKNSWGAEVLYHNIATEGSATTMVTAAVRYNWMMKAK